MDQRDWSIADSASYGLLMGVASLMPLTRRAKRSRNSSRSKAMCMTGFVRRIIAMRGCRHRDGGGYPPPVTARPGSRSAGRYYLKLQLVEGLWVRRISPLDTCADRVVSRQVLRAGNAREMATGLWPPALPSCGPPQSVPEYREGRLRFVCLRSSMDKSATTGGHVTSRSIQHS